jgi:hypothetical protein
MPNRFHNIVNFLRPWLELVTYAAALIEVIRYSWKYIAVYIFDFPQGSLAHADQVAISIHVVVILILLVCLPSLPRFKGPPSSLVQLRTAVWRGDARDTRPNRT